MSEKISVSNTEWSVMEELWRVSPQTLMELVKVMQAKLGWAKSTTSTMVRRMEEKSLILHEEGAKARLYYPCRERETLAAAETESLLERVYGGSLGMLVASMAGQKGLSQKDIDDLRRIITRAEEAGQ